MEVYFGTTNPYKVRELSSILRPLGIPLHITDPIDPEETGDTFEKNAQIKASAYGKYVGDTLAQKLIEHHACSLEEARSFLRLSQTLVISEDSGLEVRELGNLPGPWSARFSDCILEGNRVVGYKKSGLNRDAIDHKNNQKVLEMLGASKNREASFVICLTVANTDGKILYMTTKKTEGYIAEQMRGSNGFGYDPIFTSPESFGKTWAEIDSMRKALISHRRRALHNFSMWISHALK